MRAAVVAVAAALVLGACGPGEASRSSRSPTPMPTTSTVPGSTFEDLSRRELNRRLIAAARDDDVTAARGLLEAGADIDARDANRRTPLLLAAAADNVAFARLLVDRGADPDALDNRHDSAWLVTGVTGSVRMAKIVAAAKPDYGVLNRFGGTSLIPASERGHADYVAWVVENTPMKIDHVNDLGWTALLEAVILGEGTERWQRIVRTLLDAGADPAIADQDGVTPLQHARRQGQTEIVRILQSR